MEINKCHFVYTNNPIVCSTLASLSHHRHLIVKTDVKSTFCNQNKQLKNKRETKISFLTVNLDVHEKKFFSVYVSMLFVSVRILQGKTTVVRSTQA